MRLTRSCCAIGFKSVEAVNARLMCLSLGESLDLLEDEDLRAGEGFLRDWLSIPAGMATRSNNEKTNTERRTATD